MDRFTYSFSVWIWQHLPEKVKKLSLTSVIASFIKAILNPFETLITPVVNQLIDQKFLTTCSIESLRKHALQYGLEQKANESRDEFYNRLRIWRIIISGGGVKQSIKTALNIFTGLPENEIILKEGISSLKSGVFAIGQTPIGEGAIVHSTQLFTFTIILPDMTTMSLNRSFILNALDEFSPSNEFQIIEKRNGYDYYWEAA
jgi:hypothetical protein